MRNLRKIRTREQISIGTSDSISIGLSLPAYLSRQCQQMVTNSEDMRLVQAGKDATDSLTDGQPNRKKSK